jgi:bifunctional N-acetylglucosamine-1-phosphate-uridyltransferase/glucosamine-1-phosphate-acetyltransferase GlmU-like protein
MADNNTAVGVNSLGGITSGNDNTTVGKSSGITIAAAVNNTLIGSGADISSDSVTDAIAIGKDAVVGATGNMQLGSSSITNATIGDGSATLNCVIDGGNA